MNNGQEGFRNLHIASLRDGGVEIIALGKTGVAAPVVGDDGGTRCHSTFDKAAQRLGTSIRHQGKPNTASVPPGLPLIEAAGTLAPSDFNSAGHENHVVDATSFAARTTANVGFICFDDFSRLTANSVLIRPHHADAQFMKNLEGSLVAR